MGTDIHFLVEVFKDGRWKSVDKWQRASDSYLEIINSYYDDRYYYFFGLLAGVRSDREPIKEPVGFPDNLSKEVQEYVEQWKKNGYHTPTWYTIQELLFDFDWLQIDNETGEPLYTLFPEFWSYTVPRLLALGDKTRIIIFFDS